MAIPAGRRLGPYEILSAIGAGGMGEVYKARDTRLDRTVAIKVLPAHLADRADLRERFDREAKTIASLNHPHICTLHDTGHQDDIDFLVMEYLEGETLAQRLQKGALPIQLVLQYAIEISDALDKAHRKGITHRDLKPGNIMLTKSGTKLLDFGLAKLKQGAAPATPESQLATMQGAITGEGTILGTLQYMAPEQVEGRQDEIDSRTDIFAFGAVVYEMATSRKAFEGKTSASVMAKILEAEPPSMASLQPMTPPALDRVVKKCIAKEPDQRWQTASDLCGELRWIAEGGSQITSMTTAAGKGVGSLGRRSLFIGLGALLLGAAISGIAVWNLKPTPPQSVTRTVINLPPGQQLAGLDSGPAVAISPDGTRLVYVARQGGSQQIYLRAMNSLEARPIPGTEGAIEPFFSPDSQWLGFFAGGKLRKISLSGGEEVILSDSAGGGSPGASWGNQGIIAFTRAGISALQQVSDEGGASRPLIPREKEQFTHRWPEFLPDGKTVLFAAGPSVSSQVAIQSIETGESRNMFPGGTQPRYAPSGHLVFAQAGHLMAAAFDLGRLAVRGAAIPTIEGIWQSINGGAQYSFSTSGSLVYVPGSAQGGARKLVWVSRNGTEQPLPAPGNDYESPRVSPDGRQAAVSSDGQIWLYDFSRQTLTRLTFEGNMNNRPVWTPDGKRIAFYSDKEGPWNIFWQLADGSGGLERLTVSENLTVPVSFSPDGQTLAFHDVNSTTGNDLWVLRMADRKAQPFLRTRFNEANPRFSPDGHWLAYVSDESGRYEIYVQPYPGPGGKWQISTDGGTEPAWNPNGHELFYRNSSKILAVDIATRPGFSANTPRVLFQGDYVLATALLPNNYDVSPDGQRFLMLKSSEQSQAAPTQINVVSNWFEELKQKVPVGKK